MSTRATYQFITEFSDITCYIHHDGYPSGACEYLAKGSNAASFIRGNENAEITRDHELHGDTEYRYTIRDGFLTASKYEFDGESGKWAGFYFGLLCDFIDKHRED
jgi:hypothetical protein